MLAVGEILDWADIQRLQPGSRHDVQREPVKSRISSIRRFFLKEPQNTIPTAIVVAVQGGHIATNGGVTDLTVETREEVDKPGLVIDGQHRLRGMEAMHVNLRVAVVAILEPDALEIAFQFLVINNKSAKVPRDHIRALALNYSEGSLKTRLESARLSLDENVGSVGVLDEDEDSPFRGMIAWPNNAREERVIVPAAIEVIAGHAKSLGVREFDEADGLNLFLMAVWRKVKETWPDVFGMARGPNAHLLEKVGMICLTQYIVDTLHTWSKNPRSPIRFGDPADIEENTGLVLDNLEQDFFRAGWASASYDTRVGRDLILEALETISQNILQHEPWHKDVLVVDRTWLQDYMSAEDVETS